MSNHLWQEDLEMGDLIEFKRSLGLYSHWAVYIGNGEVIHLSEDIQEEAVQPRKDACVRKDKLRHVAGDSPTLRNNEFDDELRPKAKHQILQYAQEQLGRKRYNLVTYNSEHFATECRYGIPRSRQVEEVTEKALEYVTPMPLLLARNPLSAAIPGPLRWAAEKILVPSKGQPVRFQ